MLIASALLAAAAAPMPTCSGADDCEVKWGRAIRWVLTHNPTIVQQTDSLIVTAEPLGKVHKYQVTRIPDGTERYTIDLKMGCNPLRKCPREEMKAAFSAAVMGG